MAAPWRARLWEMAAPMPRVPPVTKATRPVSLPSACALDRGAVVVIKSVIGGLLYLDVRGWKMWCGESGACHGEVASGRGAHGHEVGEATESAAGPGHYGRPPGSLPASNGLHEFTRVLSP